MRHCLRFLGDKNITRDVAKLEWFKFLDRRDRAGPFRINQSRPSVTLYFVVLLKVPNDFDFSKFLNVLKLMGRLVTQD